MRRKSVQPRYLLLSMGGLPTSSDKAAAAPAASTLISLAGGSRTRVGFLFSAPPSTWVTDGSWQQALALALARSSEKLIGDAIRRRNERRQKKIAFCQRPTRWMSRVFVLKYDGQASDRPLRLKAGFSPGLGLNKAPLASQKGPSHPVKVVTEVEGGVEGLGGGGGVYLESRL